MTVRNAADMYAVYIAMKLVNMFEVFRLTNAVINQLCLLGAVQGIILFFLLVRRGKPDRVFAVIVLFISYGLVAHYIYKSVLWVDYLPFFIIRDSIGFTYGFLVFSYVRFLTGSKTSFRLTDALHLIPAFIFLVLCFSFNTHYLGLGTYSVIDFDESGFTRFRFYSQNIKNIIILIYLALSYSEARKYRKKSAENGRLSSLNSGWITVFLGVGFLLWILPLLSMNFHYFNCLKPVYPVFYVFGGRYIPEILSFGYSLSSAVSVYSAGYYILSRKNTSDLAGKRSIAPECEMTSLKYSGNGEKYRKNIIPQSLKLNYLQKIKQTMEKSMPYLDSEFSIKDLAERTGISTHNLSQIINDTFGKNFFNYINDYRLDYASRLICDPESELNILRVCYESGFNSKSVFNTAFKRKFGMTPSKFRDSSVLR